MTNEFNLDDFQRMFAQLQKLGLKQTISIMPGMGMPTAEMDEALERMQRILEAMTAEERRHPDRINDGQQLRIALASETEPADVRELLRQFDRVRSLVEKISDGSIVEQIHAIAGLSRWKMSQYMKAKDAPSLN